jgi:hypothetical protein
MVVASKMAMTASRSRPTKPVGMGSTGTTVTTTKVTAATPPGLGCANRPGWRSTPNLYIADSGHNQVKKATPDGVQTTLAGAGEPGSAGDGGPAAAARLNDPKALAVDRAKNAYIADTGNNKVRKVNSTGTISTLAGTGAPGFDGDGGQAKSARLTSPAGVAVDPLGDVFISDTLNFRIRIVDLSGQIETYAGTGQGGYSGDGGPAIYAKLNRPWGIVALDGNSVYFADSGNNRVRRIMSGPPPVIPEVSFNTITLPLSALGVMALTWGALTLRRRRSAARPAT